MAKTRPFTCCTIVWPFARLAIASFYVYSLLCGMKSLKCVIVFLFLFAEKLIWDQMGRLGEHQYQMQLNTGNIQGSN